MNVIVDPCDDFYSYACGNFIKNTEFKRNKQSITTTKLIQDRIDDRLNELLSSPMKDDEVGAYETAKLLYSSCNTAINEGSNTNDLIKILDALGGFPILKSNLWTSESFYWPKVIQKLNNFGFRSNFFIDLKIVPSIKDFDTYGGTYILQLSNPSTILTKQKLNHIRNKEEIDRYKMYILNVIRKIQNSIDAENLSKEINDVVDFETKLVQLLNYTDEAGNSENFTVGELNQNFPILDWIDFIKSFMPIDKQINDSEIVIVTNSRLLKNLKSVLLTSNRNLANYLLWRVIDSSISYISNDFKTLHDEYHIIPNYETCVELVRQEVPLITSAMYARAYLDNRNKEDLRDQVVHDIEGMLDLTTNLLPWLDETSRDDARKRLKKTIRFITVPQELSNDQIGRYYTKLPIKSTSLLYYILMIRKFHQEKDFRKLGKNVKPYDWTRFANLVNIINYKPTERYVLSIPAPLIEEQLTHENTSVIDYATVGVTVARDYIYRFMGLYDHVGHTFNSHGEWWTGKSLENFEPHLQCFIDKYGKFQTPDGVKLRSNFLKYENIVDVGALKAAHITFKLLGDTAEERLPGIQFNEPKQIFWTKAAQNWCAKYTPDSLKRELIRGNEVPGKFRVNGALMQIVDFGKDFKCKVGANMFPDKDSCYKTWNIEQKFF